MARLRLDGLDAVKLMAAALVVLEHSVLRGTGRNDVAFFIYGACHVAVPTFFAVAGYIAGLRPPPEDLSAFAATRSRRLLVPAVFWMAFFPLLAWARTARAPWGASAPTWIVTAFLGGGNAWFLVVLFFVAVLAAALDRRTSGLWPAVVGIAAFLAMGLVQTRGPVGLGLGTFYAFIPVYGAVYWAAMRFARTAWRPSTARALAAFTILTLSAGALSVVRQTTGSLVPSWFMYAVASLGALAALALSVDPHLPWTRILAPMDWARESTLGIYLVHVALISYVFALLPPFQPLVRTFVGALVTFVATAVVVSVARRWAPARAVL